MNAAVSVYMYTWKMELINTEKIIAHLYQLVFAICSESEHKDVFYDILCQHKTVINEGSTAHFNMWWTDNLKSAFSINSNKS